MASAFYEDIALAYSAQGWNDLLDAINASKFKNDIYNFLGNCDRMSIASNGDRLIIFEQLDTDNSDFNKLYDCHRGVDLFNWLCVSVYDDGSKTSSDGMFKNNPFNIGTGYTLRYQIAIDDFDGDLFSRNRLVDKPEITADESNVAVNDHTCVHCGNDRCSKKEKSCWKCGNPI